jgi:cytochrome c oxidase subunit II
MTRTVTVAIAGVALIGLGSALVVRETRARQSATGEVPVIRVTAQKFEYSPDTITLKKGVPVDLELTSLDRDHGFKVPALGIRADIKPGQVTRVRLVPQQAGHFAFACDVFCGSGHEDMTGEIIVVE